MGTTDVAVVVAGLAVTGLLGWFFFGPKTARSADLVGNVQEVRVTVKGGYSPDLIRVRQGVPLRTAVELRPDRPGEFGFACGMNMVHGKLIVEPQANGHGAPPPSANEIRSEPAAAEEPVQATDDHE